MKSDPKLKKDLLQLEGNLLEIDDYDETPPRDVLAFNEMRSCADIFRLAKEGQLDIDPDFQRGKVWKVSDQSRFVDSLTKQLPIPSMCFSVDSSTQKRIVIDGLQRTSTIIDFLDEATEWKLSDIADIDFRLADKTNREIKKGHPNLWSTVQNVMIPITVIHCDYTNASHMEYLYMIFHRLNTGSVKLNNQEIRNCIFNGNLNALLKSVGKSTEMRAIFGRSNRFSNVEYVLRLMAFHENLHSYAGHMSKYLNDYMHRNRQEDKSKLVSLIKKSLRLIDEKIFSERSTKSTSRTVLEGLVLGVMSNYAFIAGQDSTYLLGKFDILLSMDEFSPESMSEGLTAKKKVVGRIGAAVSLFKE